MTFSRFSSLLKLVACASVINSTFALIDPTAIYDGGIGNTSAPVLLRIGTGGAGQSGLVKALADAFIKDSVKNGSQPFLVGWVLADTTFTIKNLQSGEADVGITYSPTAERIAADQGFVDSNTRYLFRDHFLITGPHENPAKIDNSSDVLSIMVKIFQSAEKNSVNTTIPTRWLSRYDKSATNIKESLLWLGIGQVPWATPYTIWYHQYIAFPIQALTVAIQLKEYTLTDRGTYLSLPNDVVNQTTIYKESTDSEDDILLNPAHLLVGKKARYETVANQFAEWATGSDGQQIITNFKKNGEQLYKGAPHLNPLLYSQTVL